ncbi:MAG TPA: hypothetical protein PLV92_26070, partial [Pirellulaceae bacterium]|nr:hypothetical protein [Pirellulaceae bacterium]
HDYLVHSLREWVTQKQRESRRGRAELRLAERAATWNARPENRQLPTAWEFLTISALTARRRWTPSQAKMMSRAARVHGMRGAALLVAICLAAYAARYVDGRYHATAAVEQLESVEVEHLDLALEHVQQYRRWAEADLRSRVAAPARTADARRLKLHARLALLPIDPEQIGPLRDELLNVETSYEYAAVIRRHLHAAGPQLEGELWELLFDRSVDPIRRFHAAVALAGFAPDSERWSPEIVSFVCDQMVSINAERQPQLRNLLRPLRTRMIDDLERIFSDARKSEHEQTAAASGLAEFAADQPLRLAKLLVIASPTQYAALHPEVAASSDLAVKEFLAKLAAEPPAESLDKPQRIELGRRRAGSAITLLRAGDKTTALEALRSTADHEAQSQFVERSRSRGVSTADLIACVDELDQARQKLT